MTQDEEGTVVSTVRGFGETVAPIEIIERGGGVIILKQEDGDQILIDPSQLRKLWYVLGMHIDLLETKN